MARILGWNFILRWNCTTFYCVYDRGILSPNISCSSVCLTSMSETRDWIVLATHSKDDDQLAQNSWIWDLHRCHPPPKTPAEAFSVARTRARPHLLSSDSARTRPGLGQDTSKTRPRHAQDTPRERPGLGPSFRTGPFLPYDILSATHVSP